LNRFGAATHVWIALKREPR